MKIGLCTGVFDLFHDGHEYLLKEAAKHCGYLIVAVNNDAACRHKGPGRPFHTFARRMSNVLEVCFVGSVIPFNGHDIILAATLMPDVIIRGWDQRKGEWSGEIPVIRIDRGPCVSTTMIAAQRMQVLL
jgi:cytidyltransferase-like protein